MNVSGKAAGAAHGPRVAITHDYLVQYGGAEKVLEALHGIYPEAPIYTTFFDPHAMRQAGFAIPADRIHPLFPAWLPHSGRIGKLYTPFYPLVWRILDLRRFQLVISSTSFAAHHIRVSRGAHHVSYVHSPPRFLYGLTTEIDHGTLRRRLPLIAPLYSGLRALDRGAVRHVDRFVANSHEVKRRILRVYGRDAAVVYPPVDTASFAASISAMPGDYFLCYGRLVASKRVDIAIEAANAIQMPLVVAGSGPEESRLRKMAGPAVRFVGRLNHHDLLQWLGGCRAVVTAAEEDFGIVPVEAMAAGKPVIAYDGGGARESVIAGRTGEFFSPQTPRALGVLLRAFDPSNYQPSDCRARAATFSNTMFATRMREQLEGLQ